MLIIFLLQNFEKKLFWNICRICFLLFSIQNIKSNCYTIFIIFFSIVFFWWKIYSFLVVFIYQRFNFCYSLQILFYFFIIYQDCYSVLKEFIIFFIDMIYYCFFVFYSIMRIYIWSTMIGIYFMTFILQ